jgi:hypothetical protein
MFKRTKFTPSGAMTIEITHQENYPAENKIRWWNDGEWVHEPDIIFFTYRDYDCKIIRSAQLEPYAKIEHVYGGFLCGYVRIPFAHPFRHEIFEDMDIECHGGLTFGQVSDAHWIGFDCAHSGDFMPSTEKWKKESIRCREIYPLPKEFERFSIFNPTYKNIEFVKNECKSIVDQLIEADK